MLTWWDLAILVAGMIAGAWTWHQLLPWWDAWRILPREDREEKRRRKCRVAIYQADVLADEDKARPALKWARRAYRLDPQNPHTLNCLGVALTAFKRYELALKHFEEARSAIEKSEHVDLSPESMVQCAIQAARCCARLRLNAHTSTERDAYAEQVMTWTRIAVREDPMAAESLARDPLLRELQGQVRLLHICTDPEATT